LSGRDQAWGTQLIESTMILAISHSKPTEQQDKSVGLLQANSVSTKDRGSYAKVTVTVTVTAKADSV
jgi:hypothetical protein